jgi:hypothetical protein
VQRLTAAHRGTYRDVLEFLEEEQEHVQGTSIRTIAAAVERSADKARNHCDRGVYEGYLDRVYYAGRYWYLRTELEIPPLGAEAERAEEDRISSLKNEPVGQQWYIPGGSSPTERKSWKVQKKACSRKNTPNQVLTGEGRKKRLHRLERLKPNCDEHSQDYIGRCRMRRLALRSRETRKTLIGSSFLIPWILARGEFPQKDWAYDLGLFIDEVLDMKSLIEPEEDEKFLAFLQEPWVAGKAKSGIKTRILLISQIQRLALQALRSVRRILDSPGWRRNVGDWTLEASGDDSFMIADRGEITMKEPSLMAAGVDTFITGGHYDVQIWDDVVSERSVRSADGVRKTREVYQLAQPLLSKGGRSVLCMYGTMYDPSDLYHEILDSSGRFDTFFDPALEKEDYKVGHEGEIILSKKAESRFPKSWPMHSLREMLREMGSYHFSGQFLLDFSKVKPAFVKPEDLHWIEDDEIPDRVATYILADLAETQDSKACYTCLWVCQVDMASRKFLRDVKMGRWNPDDVCEQIEDVLRDWRPRALVTESGPQSIIYHSAWKQYAFARGLRLPWEFGKRNRDNLSKHRRMDTLPGPIRRGDILWDARMRKIPAFNDLVLPEFFRKGKVTHVDAVDALTLHDAKNERDRPIVYCPSNQALRSQEGVLSVPISDGFLLDEEIGPTLPASRFRVGYKKRS